MPQRGNSFYGVLYDTPHPVGAVRSLSLPCYYPPKSRWDFGGKEHRRHKLPFSEQEKGVNIGRCDAGRWQRQLTEGLLCSDYLFCRFCRAKPSIMHFEKMQFMTRRVNSCANGAIHGAALPREFMRAAQIAIHGA